MFKSITWNAAGMTLPNLKNGCATGANSILLLPGSEVSGTQLKIGTIKMINPINMGADDRSADLEITFDPTTLKRSLKPIVIHSLGFTLASSDVDHCLGSASTATGMKALFKPHAGKTIQCSGGRAYARVLSDGTPQISLSSSSGPWINGISHGSAFGYMPSYNYAITPMGISGSGADSGVGDSVNPWSFNTYWPL